MDTTKSVTTPVQEVKGELTYDDKVIQKIIGIALENIDGLLTVDGGFFSNIAEKLVNTNNVTSGIDVEVGKKQVAVDLDIVAEYGKDISKLFTDIQKLIVEEVKKMTGLEVIEVNVNVVDIKTKEQYEKDSVTVQDRVGSAAESTGEFASNQTDKAKKAINKGTDKAKEQMEPRVQ
ncbi:Asp23/Gls24 family envelope stress response protein [Enterococcus larvae]|nr:Asp23/Gls24 family envelope stress response protein [Enterococcus larvae]